MHALVSGAEPERKLTQGTRVIDTQFYVRVTGHTLDCQGTAYMTGSGERGRNT